jgi:hypothetical protein
MRRMPYCTPFRVEASRSIGRAVLQCAALLAFGCETERALQNPLPPAASAGDEPPPMAAATTEKKAPKPRYGSVLVRAFVRDTPVSGRVRLLDAERPVEGDTGEVIQVEAGTQRVEVTLNGNAGLLDKPTQRLQVFVSAREQAIANAYFPWSKVAFTVFQQGRRQAGVPIKLLRNAQVVAELRSGATPQALSPGKYEVEVQLRGRTVHVDRLSLLEGATQNIPLQF